MSESTTKGKEPYSKSGYLYELSLKKPEEVLHNELFHANLLQRCIDKIKSIPNLEEQFFALEFEIQLQVMKHFAIRQSKWNVAAFVELVTLLDLTADQLETIQTRSQISEASPDSTFESEYSKLLKHYLTHKETSGSLVYYSLVFLRRIYGVSMMVEVLTCWNSKESEGTSVYDLLKFCQRWDELKSYPLEWSVQVIGKHL